MNVLMATSWGVACGISDYAEQAITAVQAADRTINVQPIAQTLDPQKVLAYPEHTNTRVLWLNYHRGLHSQWTPEACQAVVAHLGCKLLITFHDTRGEAEPDPLQVALHDLADAFVVHEPVLGLPKAVVIRQGVAAGVCARQIRDLEWLAYWHQPILGTVGFNQGWREFDQLATITADQGWALMILSNNATHEDEQRWREANPHLMCLRGWLQRDQLIGYLSACDATAFVHRCANTGTSGAIRLGLAARKPVIAVLSRQYRDLREDRLGQAVILWCDGLERLRMALGCVDVGPVDPSIVALAERDSWRNQGRRYAEILKGLVS